MSNLLACLSEVTNFKVSPEFQLFCHWFSFYVQHSTKEIHLSLLDMYAWPCLYLCTHSTIVPLFFDMIQIFLQQCVGNSPSVLICGGLCDEPMSMQYISIFHLFLLIYCIFIFLFFLCIVWFLWGPIKLMKEFVLFCSRGGATWGAGRAGPPNAPLISFRISNQIQNYTIWFL